jgi:hypothetical protein
MARLRLLGVPVLTGCLALTLALGGAAREKSVSSEALEQGLRRSVGYLASDELAGRDTFSEGLTKASEYLARELRAAGVEPAGDNGSYFQTVDVAEVSATNRSRITVEAGGERRTFDHGAGFTLPDDAGARRTLTSRDLVFVGYGLFAPHLGHDDYAAAAVSGKVVVWLGGLPSTHAPDAYGGAAATRALFATEQKGAAASIGGEPFEAAAACAAKAAATSCSPGAGSIPSSPHPTASCATSGKSCGVPGAKSCGVHRGPGGASGAATFVTASRLDSAGPPRVTARDELLEFLFRGASVPYGELKRKVQRGEPLPAVTFAGVSITFDLDVRYEVLNTRRSRNVVALVEGSDPRLKHTYVAFGAHYDHLGVAAEPGVARAAPSTSCSLAPATPSGDAVFNGADDNASGTAALLALAQDFARGPRPRRSILFVWHTGEERGMWGSRFFADHPTVPLDVIVAHVNLDMVGRSHLDRPENVDRLFLVGSDWISSELHTAAVATNAGLPAPFELDFSMNSPADGGLAYYRSDHYSYASKGVPSVFITSGPHGDYHAASDTADKIDYAKLARVVDYAGALGLHLANLDRAPARDFAGPRAGVLSKARVGGTGGGTSCAR